MTTPNAEPLDPGAAKPPPPVKPAGPAAAWTASHPNLYDNVRKALTALPHNFQSETNVQGIGAADVFAYNTALGSAIEIAVVAPLNKMRSVWDPDNAYPTYAFKRHSQSFPDVRLEDSDPASPEPILIGIEVKGWFALSKEAEPSFRYLVTPAACASQDLVVVVPWHFDNVISGRPVLLPLFIEQARYAAAARNYYWTWERKGSRGAPKDLVNLSEHATPYPAKADLCSDKPVYDGGSNFGRLARAGLMKEFVEKTLDAPAAGIPLKYWIAFLKVFTDGSTAESNESEMTKLVKAVADKYGLSAENRRSAVPFLQALLKAAEE